MTFPLTRQVLRRLTARANFETITEAFPHMPRKMRRNISRKAAAKGGISPHMLLTWRQAREWIQANSPEGKGEGGEISGDSITGQAR
jgi:hypothetical protein